MFCRIKKINKKYAEVVEVFNFNPFEWIPNPAFLENCIPCPEYVKAGMIYMYENGQFFEDTNLIIDEEDIDPEKLAMAEAIVIHEMEIQQLKAELAALKGEE